MIAVTDKIIRFPGRQSPAEPPTPPAPPAPPGLEALSEEQRKALQVILSGMAFVCVGIRPTESGADFYTAVQGDATDLRNALPHLGGVIERAFARRGLL